MCEGLGKPWPCRGTVPRVACGTTLEAVGWGTQSRDSSPSYVWNRSSLLTKFKSRRYVFPRQFIEGLSSTGFMPSGGNWAGFPGYARTAIASGSSYGAGTYRTSCNNMLNPGLSGEWPPSGAFDNTPGHTNGRNGWHRDYVNPGPYWLQLELPYSIVLDQVNIQARKTAALFRRQMRGL